MSELVEDLTNVTPSKKKLVQARLPFKVISEPDTTVSRKRKLSSHEDNTVTKIGRISKENETIDIPIVVSDDENSCELLQKDDKLLNPFVKIVDNALKKKEEKAKLTKKRKSERLNNSLEEESFNETDLSMKDLDDNKSSLEIMDTTDESILNVSESQKKLGSAKKMEKEERDKKRQQEKEERARAKQDKEDQRKKEKEEKEELKRKQKEEKEEQKRKEKEEKEKQKELEKKIREEKEEQKRKEKEEKEEQRRKEKEEKEEQKRKEKEEKEDQRKKEKEAREEERRKKQEAFDLEKQEQELKKKKAAEAFANFFVKQKVEKDSPTCSAVSKNDVLSSFTIKLDMRLAPTIRCSLTEERKTKLETELLQQNEQILYLGKLKEGAKTGRCGKTWPFENKDDDVIIVEDELPPLEGVNQLMNCEATVIEKLRPKLLSFHENRRPPYWGTWRKKSSSIKPRAPFGQDEKILDYEVDSDEEWEEEEGESIDGSKAGSDDEINEADDYDVDNEFLVPHGYLSDEEATMDGDDLMSLSPEAQKARLKHLEDEFENEMKKPMEKIKPRIYGPIWETSDGGKPDNCPDALWTYFGKLSMIMGDVTSLLQPPKESEETDKKKVRRKKSQGDVDSPKSEKKKKLKVEVKDTKKATRIEIRRTPQDPKKNQPVINSFLKKLNT